MAPSTPQIRPLTPPCLSHTLSGGAGAEPLPAASAAGILDQLQTSSQGPVAMGDSNYPIYDVNPDWIPFEHRGWHAIRMKVRDAMEATGQPIPRAVKFLGCGDETYIYQNAADGEIDYHGSRCGDRFCMVCGQSRSHRISRALAALIEKEQPLFITLTVRGKPGDSLASLIDRLTEGWKELRRLRMWKEKIRGGAIMLEVKYSKTSGGHWHPHYHILAHGTFIEKQWLADAWRLITRDSDQVDVQRVQQLSKALSYVTKYASKPLDGSFTMRPHLLQEAMKTLKGRRLCACFGSWYGTALNDSPEEVDGEEKVLTQWRFVGTERDIAGRAERGDPTAVRVLAAVQRARRIRYALLERLRSESALRGTAPPPVPGPDLASIAS